ncbi:MAG: SUMF1/EgtB/PvdO family nonheme iron enzyme [Spirochaetia bacterium]|nr:SUMF1/EgtB/PvdO family nonheme iron enzyme [Spirochaetia bacterium]
MKVKFFLTLLFISILIASCDRKPDLAYLDACAHPDALKEVKYYVKHKISDTEGLLIAAEKNTNEKIVKELLKSKNIEDKEKYAALWTSMENKNIEVFNVLLKATKGENTYQNNTGTTILMRACEKGKTDIVKLLVEAGANVNNKRKNGDTAFSIACSERFQNTDIINLLLAAGADVNTADEDGKTPLIKACISDDLNMINILIKARADVNAKDKNGYTPLMVSSNTDIVKDLLAAGADVKIKAADGFTALVQAYNLNNNEIKNILIKAGADTKDVYEYFGTKMVPIPGKNFEMLETEVTQGLYKLIMGKNPSSFKGDKLPVECVSWYDAVQFCNALSNKFGLSPVYTINGTTVTQNASANGFRLPTEAEWEYAAKGGENFTYAGSSNINEVALYYGNSNYRTLPVAQKKANGYGLYDMSGNVWEWCWDVYPNSDNDRCVRGGSWNYNADYCRVSFRLWIPADYRYSDGGFRVVRNIK